MSQILSLAPYSCVVSAEGRRFSLSKEWPGGPCLRSALNTFTESTTILCLGGIEVFQCGAWACSCERVRGLPQLPPQLGAPARSMSRSHSPIVIVGRVLLALVLVLLASEVRLLRSGRRALTASAARALSSLPDAPFLTRRGADYVFFHRQRPRLPQRPSSSQEKAAFITFRPIRVRSSAEETPDG